MKHVTILGRAEIVWPLPHGEVWGLNGFPRTVREELRVTRQFQLHPLHVLDKYEQSVLKQFRLHPTYTVKYYRAYPYTVQYPLQKVLQGPQKGLQGPFASSFDYMMALAIKEQFTSILLTGIDYQNGTLRERLCEHVSLAYWVGVARGKGITVQISPKSTLLKFPYRYGFDYDQERQWGQQQGREALQCKELDDGQARRRRVKGVVASGLLLREVRRGRKRSMPVGGTG